MPHWHPSRWFPSRRSPEEQEYHGFPLHQRPQGEIERPAASHHPITTNTAWHLSTPMLPALTRLAMVIERLLLSHTEHEYDMFPDFLAECRSNIDILDRDLQYLDERGEDAVPEQERASVEQLAENSQFFSWLNSQESEHPLVHGRYDVASHISGLSLWCVSLVHGLDGDTRRLIPLVFFCGLHTRQSSYTHTAPPSYDDIGLPSYEDDIRPPGYNNSQLPSTGGHILIRSFIYQLLPHLRPTHTHERSGTPRHPEKES